MKLVSIKENHLFQKVYLKGKKAVGRYTAVYILTDIHAQKIKKSHPLKISVNRVGITVTKKAGGAVRRNRVKRVIREAYRQICSDYEVRYGKLVVISARDAAVTAKTQDVKEDLKKSFARLGMLCATKEVSSVDRMSKPNNSKITEKVACINDSSYSHSNELTVEVDNSFESAADVGSDR